MCRELVPDRERDGRLVIRKVRQSRSESAFTRRTQLVTDRVAVVQIECA